MTPDAAFGHERRGTPATVAALGDGGRVRRRGRAAVHARRPAGPQHRHPGRDRRRRPRRGGRDARPLRRGRGRGIARRGGGGRQPGRVRPAGRAAAGRSVPGRRRPSAGRRPIRATAALAAGSLALDVPLEGRVRITFASTGRAGAPSPTRQVRRNRVPIASRRLLTRSVLGSTPADRATRPGRAERHGSHHVRRSTAAPDRRPGRSCEPRVLPRRPPAGHRTRFAASGRGWYHPQVQMAR